MTRLLQNVQDQMQRRVRDVAIIVSSPFCVFSNNVVRVCVIVQEEDAAEAHGREEASDRRLQQLQAALNQLEAR